MKTKTIKFAEDFTDTPGGRARIHGDYSGEQFREDILEPALVRYDRVVLNLNGVYSIPASFIDEAFGILVDRLGIEKVRTQLSIVLDDNPIALQRINGAMAGHAA